MNIDSFPVRGLGGKFASIKSNLVPTITRNGMTIRLRDVRPFGAIKCIGRGIAGLFGWEGAPHR